MREYCCIECIHLHCIDFIMVEEERHFFVQGEEDDLSPLQKPNKEIIMKQCLAFKYNLSHTIVDMGK